MLIFNPEHDLCLANGDPNFVAPASSLRFGHDCQAIMNYASNPDHFHRQQDLCVWGWDACVRNKLLKQGIDISSLPSDVELETIRQLSHRRTAICARKYIVSNLCPVYAELCTQVSPVEINDMSDALNFLDIHRQIVLKAPWSGSGKGIRWAHSDDRNRDWKAWFTKTVNNQGSVIAEARDNVVLDFAMLFYIRETQNPTSAKDGCFRPFADFIGYSMFECSNGAYRSNILASDEYIRGCIGKYVPMELIDKTELLLKQYLRSAFYGSYEGYVGVDMYICECGGKYLLQPCVEINVRHTMGLIAHNVFKKYYNEQDSGNYKMCVIHNADNTGLEETLQSAERILAKSSDIHSEYAIAVFQ